MKKPRKTTTPVKLTIEVIDPVRAATVFGNPEGFFHVKVTANFADPETAPHNRWANDLWFGEGCTDLCMYWQGHRDCDHLYWQEPEYRGIQYAGYSEARNMYDTLRKLGDRRRKQWDKVYGDQDQTQKLRTFAGQILAFGEAVGAGFFELHEPGEPLADKHGWNPYGFEDGGDKAYTRLQNLEQDLISRYGKKS